MGSSSTTGKMHIPQLLLLPLLVVAFSSLDCHGAQSIITVVGSVVSQATNAPFSGALVGVRCQDGDGRIVFLRQATTDRCGGFRVHLNPSAADTRRLASVKSCSVQPLQRPKSSNAPVAPPCSETAAATRSGDIVSIGAFSVRPEQMSLLPPLIPGVPSPPSSILPPVPLIPPIPKIPGIPQIPPIPKIPGVPVLPPIPLNPGGPPAPLLPPSILPPVPKIPGVPLLPPIPPLIPGGPPAA
ncbi:homeobox protein ESX1 [Brachypodium distachyon]|uniref:Uncharacterized protein n=1 Tax=Brachypodium distachyon TaxID=15368 RepID=I1IVJ3_BRADI|nr:homeobox protein ESX1 [Brachypodium distachyon]KQJ81466.2 hypothetical protein BRADI_5g00900v3 [Brachypodium distachyon]|eukprot:XP_014751116.1 homeobox protein ESX1 [Brachypodium distachyon]